MRAARLHRSRWLALVAITIALVPAIANAQVSPTWDHYKLYNMIPVILPPAPIPVVLNDQFGLRTHDVQWLALFMNPTVKEVTVPTPGIFPINNPDLHYSWWRINQDGFSGVVAANNQFGNQTLNVYGSAYLLNPARKDQPGAPPTANHYKCYDCDGPSIQIPVTLTDQFDRWSTVVFFPRYFCNPVEKQVAGQPPHPIIEPNQHYVCYTISPQDPIQRVVTMTDQFMTNQTIQLNGGLMLCVPTDKLGVTPTARDTWGKVKMLYR